MATEIGLAELIKLLGTAAREHPGLVMPIGFGKPASYRGYYTDLAFEPAMLSWPKGRHASDGCWAPHWYARVWASTGFAPYRPKREPLPERLEPLAARCRPYYDRLHEHRIRAD